MWATFTSFVADKWALLGASGKTTFCIGVALGVVARSII
jgi:hypothetical protein